MLEITDGFIGYKTSMRDVLYTGADDEKKFIDNLRKNSDDWYYRDKIISYKRNSLGHRCNDADKIDLNNYILFTGCSHTEGVGLELEKTYPKSKIRNVIADVRNKEAMTKVFKIFRRLNAQTKIK
jgi:hypothetical protein